MNKPENASHDAGILMESLIRAGRMAENELEAALAPSGLSIARLGVLKTLAQAEGTLTPGQIAERLTWVRSEMPQVVGKMEAAGLVTRVPDPQDPKSIRAAITEEGLSKLTAGLDTEAKVEGELFVQLSIEERTQLLNLLRRFSSRLRRLV